MVMVIFTPQYHAHINLLSLFPLFVLLLLLLLHLHLLISKQHLFRFREGLATARNKANVLILTPMSIIQIAVRLPQTEEQLRMIDGIPSSKMPTARCFMKEVKVWLEKYSGGVQPSGE